MKNLMQIIFVSFVFYLVTAATQVFYTHGELNGSFSKFMLPSSMFGVPKHLQERGIEPLSRNLQNTGWDGQFYFYISNDLFASRGTETNIDAPAYRYQRIGLPLAAAIIAKVTLQEWVSPMTYYFCQFLVIFTALLMLTRFLQSQNINGIWSLLWGLGVGTQLTMSRGLPDGFADACLIIAVLSLFKQNFKLSAFFLSFAVLSREIYIVVPLVFILGYLIKTYRSSSRLQLRQFFFLCLPVILFSGWQIWIRYRFSQSPSEAAAAGGILDPVPFRTWWKMFAGSRHGYHPLNDSYEWKLLLSFLGLFALTTFSLLRSTVSNWKALNWPQLVNWAALPILAVYACFGQTVMHHYSGYFKAATIFFFLLLINISIFEMKWRFPVLVFAALFGWLPFKTQLAMARTYPGSTYFEYSQFWDHKKLKDKSECLQHDPQFELAGIKEFSKKPRLGMILKRTPIRLVRVKFSFQKTESVNPTLGKGRLAFQAVQFGSDEKIINRGIETVLQNEIQGPDAIELELPILMNLDDSRLGIAYSQNGCFSEKIVRF